MQPNEHIETIMAALEDSAQTQNGMTDEEYAQWLADIRAAAQWLRALDTPAQVGQDAPDSEGFWAWEDGDNKGVSEVYKGFRSEMIIDEEPGGLTVDYFSGRKWYKLHMPWERQRPAAGQEAGE